jgi:phosphate transport system protein
MLSVKADKDLDVSALPSYPTRRWIMIRTSLDKELQELDAQMLQLGALAENALTRALEALESNDRDESGEVIVSDTVIDTLDETIEEHVFRVMTLQQPLGGRDLRYLTSLQPITIDLERIGDEAESIAANVLHMVPLRSNQTEQQTPFEYSLTNPTGEEYLFTEDTIMHDVLDLGKKVRRLMQETMKRSHSAMSEPPAPSGNRIPSSIGAAT